MEQINQIYFSKIGHAQRALTEAAEPLEWLTTYATDDDLRILMAEQEELVSEQQREFLTIRDRHGIHYTIEYNPTMEGMAEEVYRDIVDRKVINLSERDIVLCTLLLQIVSYGIHFQRLLLSLSTSLGYEVDGRVYTSNMASMEIFERRTYEILERLLYQRRAHHKQRPTY